MYRFSAFMRGRYGMDELNISLFVLAVVLSIVRFFIFFRTVRLVLWIIEILFLAFAVFRALSRNIERRYAENQWFKPIYHAATGWLKFTYRRFRDGRTHRYYKCPKCKAQLRVKNIKGEHTIRCPKCGCKFRKKIL